MPIAALDYREKFSKLDIELAKLPSEAERKIFGFGFAAAGRVIGKKFKRRGFMFEDRTGRLRGSFKVTRKGAFARASYGGSGAKQAHLIEFGTERGIKARKPLRVAAYSTTDEQLQKAAETMRRRLDKLRFDLR